VGYGIKHSAKYLRRTTSGAAGNGLFKPMPLITHVPLHHKRPASALFAACLVRQQADIYFRGLGFRYQVFCVKLELFFLVLIQG